MIRVPPTPVQQAVAYTKSARTHALETDLLVAATHYAMCLALTEQLPSVAHEQALRQAAHQRGFASQQYLDSLFRDVAARLEHPS